MGEAIISIKNLSKSFGDHEVLRKIDIEVGKGEVICIVGSSGSGKSTLLRCINKLERQTDGKIMYHGKEVRDIQREINDYRSKVGMVFQSFNLFNNMTVLENCMLCTRKVLHVSKEEAFDRAITHLKEVGMAPYINARPSQLSGGQKQRVAIARSLCMNPEVLLFDEPTSALDPISTSKIEELMEELKKMDRIMEREYPNARRETFIVLDATTGQNALVQAKEFSEVAEISGIVLTKMDGTAKGGVAVAIEAELGLKVKYIGYGEKIDDLKRFDVDEYVRKLFE